MYLATFINKHFQGAYHNLKRHFTRSLYLAMRTIRISAKSPLAESLRDYRSILALAQSDIRHHPPKTEKSKGKVLFFTSASGWHHVTSLEMPLHRLLEERGYQTDAIVCDQLMVLCDLMSHRATDKGRQEICRRCFVRGKDMFQAVNIPFRKASAVLSSTQRRELQLWERNLQSATHSELSKLVLHNIPIGEIATASALRFLRRGTWPEIETGTTNVLRDFVYSALRIKAVAESYLEEFARPDIVIMTHGIYVPWGPARAVFEREGIPVACYDQSSIFKEAFVTSWNQPSQACDLTDIFESEKGNHLSPAEAQELRDYLLTRRNSSRDKTKFNITPELQQEEMRAAYDIPRDAVCFGLFTNLLWDAATVARASCFKDQVAWLVETVEYFIANPHKYLILRVHPAETLRGTSQSVYEEIAQRFSLLPHNIRLIGKTPPVNAYSVYNTIDVGIVNTSTVGLELSLLGKPVIVVSQTHYGNKGFTYDPNSRQEYFAFLDQMTLGTQLSSTQIAEAERYAHMFFFRHQLQLGFFSEDKDTSYIVEARLNNPKSSHTQEQWMNSLLSRTSFVLPRDIS